MIHRVKNLTVAITVALSVGTISGCASTSASSVEAGTGSTKHAETEVFILGTSTPFASEAIYFVMTDRFVDGDSSNNYEDQGGKFPTWQLPMEGPNGEKAYVGYMGGGPERGA